MFVPGAPGRAPLPVTAGRLIGRSAELDRVTRLVKECGERLVTATGPPGVGKTRLAVEGAARLVGDAVEGAAFADLTTIRDPDLVLPEISGALGLPAAAGDEPGTLARALGDRDVLVVLDNVEHVLPAAPAVAAVLAACPGLRIIATGRGRLDLAAEHELPVEPLALPDEPDALDLATLAAAPAPALLVERVRRFDPAFALTPANRAPLTEVCRLLDGLPLAIELAAARLRLYSPAELAGLLRRRPGGLDGGAGDAPARHRTLDAAVGWSHELLSEAERVVVRRAAVFVGGADLAAVHAVCDPEADRGPVVDVVGSLIDKSLLGRSGRSDTGTEFRMLASVRDYAAARLAAAGETAAARDRHAEHFAGWAVCIERLIGTPEEGAAVAELGPERGNLGAALEHAVAADLGPAVVVPLAFAVGLHAFTRGRFGEGAALLERLLPSVQGAPPTAPLVGLHVVAGATAYARGALGSADLLLEQGIVLADTVDAPRWRAFATAFLGHVAGARGRPDRAAAAYRRAGAMYAAASNATGEAWSRYDLGLLARRRSDVAGATRHLRASLDSFRQIGYRWATACSACALGSVEVRHGAVDDAAPLFAEALRTVQPLDDRLGVARCLEGAAAVAVARGRPRAAARLLGAAEARRLRIGAPLPAEDRPDRVALDARLVAELGAGTFDRERDAGRRQATAVALAHEVLRDAPHELAALTVRERQVARLVATGRTDRQIARVLGIAERTVHAHVRHVIHKLGVGGRAGVAAQITNGHAEVAE